MMHIVKETLMISGEITVMLHISIISMVLAHLHKNNKAPFLADIKSSLIQIHQFRRLWLTVLLMKSAH